MIGLIRDPSVLSSQSIRFWFIEFLYFLLFSVSWVSPLIFVISLLPLTLAFGWRLKSLSLFSVLYLDAQSLRLRTALADPSKWYVVGFFSCSSSSKHFRISPLSVFSLTLWLYRLFHFQTFGDFTKNFLLVTSILILLWVENILRVTQTSWHSLGLVL